jgi:hypothetical protein
MSGALLNALTSVFPLVARQVMSAVPFASSPLSESFVEDLISSIDSLTSLLINESHRETTYHHSPSTATASLSTIDPSSSAALFSFSHHYLPIILCTLISLDLQLRDYLNHRIRIFYSKNSAHSLSQSFDLKQSPGPGVAYNIHQFNKRSSALSPRIMPESLLRLQHALEGSVNQIVSYYSDVVLSTYSYPPDVTQRIEELLKKRDGQWVR